MRQMRSLDGTAHEGPGLVGAHLPLGFPDSGDGFEIQVTVFLVIKKMGELFK